MVIWMRLSPRLTRIIIFWRSASIARLRQWNLEAQSAQSMCLRTVAGPLCPTVIDSQTIMVAQLGLWWIRITFDGIQTTTPCSEDICYACGQASKTVGHGNVGQHKETGADRGRNSSGTNPELQFDLLRQKSFADCSIDLALCSVVSTADIQ